jgi:hypothetical protein
MLPTKLTSAARFGSFLAASSVAAGMCGDAVDVSVMKILSLDLLFGSPRPPAARARRFPIAVG